MSRLPLAAVTALLTLPACSSGSDVLDPGTIFGPGSKEVRFEVAYMDGAEPYVTDTESGQPAWNFLKSNVSGLFEGAKTVTVPTSLDGMTEIPAGNTDYSTEEILALEEAYRTSEPYKDGVATFFVLFLDGSYVEDGVKQESVLGVSLGNTGVIAVFKPAITSNVSFLFPRVRVFTEQTVLIHEAGHALGLVDNGLEPMSDHKDEKHGAHCTNPRCVMYYLNEGVKDVIEFLQNEDPGIDTVIFGDECLADAAAASE
jgi:predicted Zn-dependent protease